MGRRLAAWLCLAVFALLCAVDSELVVKVVYCGRSERAHPFARGNQYARKKFRGRTLAVRARDMDNFKRVVGTAEAV